MSTTLECTETGSTAKNKPSRVVSSFTEWGLLEEVVVGVVEGAYFPPWHSALEPVLPENMCSVFKENAGQPFPAERIAAASNELEEFVHILEAEGVKVRRPDPIQNNQSYGAPGWTSTGLYQAMPRDLLLVIGNDMIECPLAWRSRYCEVFSYRKLLKEYFGTGCKWSSAPKPELREETYNTDWTDDLSAGKPLKMAVSEYEPTFDAADFARCGKDIIAQKSHVTNQLGIDWLQRHLGDQYKIHVLEFNDTHPMHIDATLVPLAPGKLLINPKRVTEVPAIFKGWDVFHAPKPVIPDEHTLYMTSKWINMNILMLDEQRVIVEKQDQPMIDAMKKWGFKPIPCNFRNFNSFGGSFHCATLDIRRQDKPGSYLSY